MKQQQYIVSFSDKKGAKVHIYGAFVSETMAYNFCEQLPDPISGHKGVKPLSQFTHDEAHLACDEIMSLRLQTA